MYIYEGTSNGFQ